MEDKADMSFWEHLDVLRGTLIKIIAGTAICGIMAFILKDEVFSIILAPKDSSFITYRLLDKISASASGTTADAFSVDIINTGLAGQFVTHMKIAVCTGMLLISPYAIYLLFGFLSPALYANERKYSLRIVISGYVMFVIGMLTAYFLIFPLTFRFLGTYQVSSEIPNMITLPSYINTLITMCIMLGILFELPVLTWILSKAGILSAGIMRHFRKHAIVVIFIIAAVITPTSDMFTMSAVAVPVCLLYEASILIAAGNGTSPRRKKQAF